MLLAAIGFSSGCAIFDSTSSEEASKGGHKDVNDGPGASDASQLDGSAEDARDLTPDSQGLQDIDEEGADTPNAPDGQDKPDGQNEPDAHNQPDVHDEPDDPLIPDGTEEITVGFTEQSCEVSGEECASLNAAYKCAQVSCREYNPQDDSGEKRCFIDYKSAGTECAPPEGICDLPTVCTGDSGFCAPRRYLGAGEHCCMPGAGDSVVQGLCNGERIACQYTDAGYEAGACGSLQGGDLPEPYDQEDLDRTLTVESISFDGFDSRVLIVEPGQSIKMNIDYYWVRDNQNIRVHFFFGINGQFEQCATGTSLGPNQSYDPPELTGIEFNAPGEPGIYYLNPRLSNVNYCTDPILPKNVFSPRLTPSTLAVIRVLDAAAD